MKYGINLICALLMLSFLAGCYNDTVLPQPVGEVPQDVSFSQDIIPIFNSDCNSAGCHNTGGIPPDLTAANAFSALISGGYIDTADPSNSELYEWMAGNRDTPMPLSGINATNNALVLAWIEQGALDN